MSSRGDVRIEGSRKSDLDGAVGANVCVVKRDTLVLAGDFTGCIWLDGPDAATGLRFCDVMYKEESEYSWEDPEEVPGEDPEEVPVRFFEFTGASPKPVFVEPGPIAFQSIERQDDDWVLVATNARRWCWYSLWSGTTPETNGFELVEGSSNQWMSADGPITNRVPVRESESSRFWLLRGAQGCAPSITEGR